MEFDGRPMTKREYDKLYSVDLCQQCGEPIIFSPMQPKKLYAFKIRMFGRKTLFFCSWNCMKAYEESRVFGQEWHPGCVKVGDFWLRAKSTVGAWAGVPNNHALAEKIAKKCNTAQEFRRAVAKITRHICISCFGLIASSDMVAGRRTCTRCREKLRRQNAKRTQRKRRERENAAIRRGEKQAD